MKAISTDNAPPAGGHYSQAIVSNSFVFVAGQLPIKPGGGREIPEGIEDQTRQAMANLKAILEAAGSGLDKLVSVNIFVTDVAHWPAVNGVFAEMMGDHKPARAISISPQLHFGAMVEVQATAEAG